MKSEALPDDARKPTGALNGLRSAANLPQSVSLRNKK
jgi:hypothetical protein